MNVEKGWIILFKLVALVSMVLGSEEERICGDLRERPLPLLNPLVNIFLFA